MLALILAEVFVGRERELDRLRAAAEEAAAGRGGIVLITGEPGIPWPRRGSAARRCPDR